MSSRSSRSRPGSWSRRGSWTNPEEEICTTRPTRWYQITGYCCSSIKHSLHKNITNQLSFIRQSRRWCSCSCVSIGGGVLQSSYWDWIDRRKHTFYKAFSCRHSYLSIHLLRYVLSILEISNHHEPYLMESTFPAKLDSMDTLSTASKKSRAKSCTSCWQVKVARHSICFRAEQSWHWIAAMRCSRKLSKAMLEMQK